MNVLDIPIALVGLVFVAVVVRMYLGPTQADRAACADLAFFSFIALVALLGVRYGRTALFDVALLATLTGFVATIWMARLLRREKPEEGTDQGRTR